MLPGTRDLAVLSVPAFRRFAVARTISTLGSAYGPIALSFGALEVFHGDAFPLSVVLAAQAIPQVLLILVGGVLADRLGQRQLIIFAEMLAALAWAALAVLVGTHHQSVVLMAIAAATAGTASALVNPALVGLVPHLVDDEHLQAANGFLRLGNNASKIAGLASAGAAVVAFGPGLALAVNAASFLVAGLLVATLCLPRVMRARTTTREDLAIGWREFRSRQWLWVSVCQFTIVIAATNAYAGVFGPLIAREDLGGPQAWALLLLFQALGAVFGVLVAIRVRPRRPIFVAAALAPVLAMPMLLLAMGAPLVLAALAAFAAGVANDIYGVLWATTMQREVPRHAISRVSAFDFLGSTALAPIGLFVAGPIAGELGARATAAVFAGAIVAATALALCAPGLRSVTTRPAEPRLRDKLATAASSSA